MNVAEDNDFLAAYDAHADAIYRHCFFRVFSKERAEELVQETFLRAWEYSESGKNIENMRAFLYRTATNLIIDHARKKKEERLDDVLEASPSLEPSRDERGDLEGKMLWQSVRSAMDTLPSGDREVLVLRYVDELEPREIAEVLGITAGNASVKINRALEKLKTIVREA